jgi:hypothetical protein
MRDGPAGEPGEPHHRAESLPSRERPSLRPFLLPAACRDSSGTPGRCAASTCWRGCRSRASWNTRARHTPGLRRRSATVVGPFLAGFPSSHRHPRNMSRWLRSIRTFEPVPSKVSPEGNADVEKGLTEPVGSSEDRRWVGSPLQADGVRDASHQVLGCLGLALGPDDLLQLATELRAVEAGGALGEVSGQERRTLGTSSQLISDAMLTRPSCWSSPVARSRGDPHQSRTRPRSLTTSHNRFSRAFLPRCSRDMTVPMGTPVISAISL